MAFTYYPLIKLYVEPTPLPAESSINEYFLSVPKIGAYAPIILNVDPWNENDYLPVLPKGIAQARGSSVPGQKGSIFLFAHSSDFPWRMTRYNTAFLRLGELQIGDQVVITKGGKTFKYTVKDKKEVWPTDIQYLKNPQGDQLILQTCTPIGTSLKRLLVFAEPT